jgi:hypothetical protein
MRPVIFPQSGLLLISDEREVTPRLEAVDAWLGMRGPAAAAAAMTPRQMHVSDHLGFQAGRKAK